MCGADLMALPRDTKRQIRLVELIALLSNAKRGIFFLPKLICCLPFRRKWQSTVTFAYISTQTESDGFCFLISIFFLSPKLLAFFLLQIDKYKCWNSHYHWRIWWMNNWFFMQPIAYQIRNEMQITNEIQLPNRLNNNFSMKWRRRWQKTSSSTTTTKTNSICDRIWNW